MIVYSLGLVIGYGIAKWVTPLMPSLVYSKYHLHHWIWATTLLSIMLLLGDRINTANWYDSVCGVITGIALQGLSYKNWSIKRNMEE